MFFLGILVGLAIAKTIDFLRSIGYFESLREKYRVRKEIAAEIERSQYNGSF